MDRVDTLSYKAAECMPPADARAAQRKMLLRNVQPGSKNAGAFLNYRGRASSLPFIVIGGK